MFTVTKRALLLTISVLLVISIFASLGAFATAGEGTGPSSSPPVVNGISNGMGTTALMENGQSNTISAIVFDAAPPEVHIIAPTDGSYNTTGSVTLAWTVTDIDGISLTEVSLGGSSWITVVGTSHVFQSLSDGTYTAYVRVTDGVGNTNTTYVSFTVDTVSPSVIMVSPSNNTYNTTGTVEVRWTGDEPSDFDRYEVRLNEGTWTTTPWTNRTYQLADGFYTVAVRAYDLAGNYNETSVSFVVDTLAPTAVIIAPSDGSFTGLNIITIKWRAGDATSGLSRTEISVDGGAWMTVSGSSYLLEDLTDGEHTAEVKVFDRAGLIGTSSLILFTVDTTGPDVEVLSPDGFYKFANLTAEWWAEDDLSEIAYYVVSIDGTGWVKEYGTTHLFSGLADGEHTITVRAYDMLGNYGEASAEFSIASTELKVTVSPIGKSVGVNAVIVARFSHEMDLATIVITISNGVEGEISFQGNVATFTPERLAQNTQYNVTVYGFDLAGDYVSKSWSFTTAEKLGTVVGGAVDADGNAIVGVVVTLSNGQSAVTDENGSFKIEAVGEDSYTLTMTKTGYKATVISIMVADNIINDVGVLTMAAAPVTTTPSSSSDDTVLVGAAILAAIVALVVLYIFLSRRA